MTDFDSGRYGLFKRPQRDPLCIDQGKNECSVLLLIQRAIQVVPLSSTGLLVARTSECQLHVDRFVRHDGRNCVKEIQVLFARKF